MMHRCEQFGADAVQERGREGPERSELLVGLEPSLGPLAKEAETERQATGTSFEVQVGVRTNSRLYERQPTTTARRDDGVQRLHSLIDAGRKLEAVLRQSAAVNRQRAA